MGHVQSKRKKEKQIKRNISDYILNSITNGDPENYKMTAQMKLNRLSADVERLSAVNSYRDSLATRDSWRLSKTSELSDSWQNSQMSEISLESLQLNKMSGLSESTSGQNIASGLSDDANSVQYDVKSSASFQELNVDNHPVLTKLQNEQNVRLEKMEERMSQIRLHAMQEVERRKYAHLFKAKHSASSITDLLNQVKHKLPKTCDNGRSKSLQQETGDDDKGEIIPVTIVTEKQKERKEDKSTDECGDKKKSYLQSLPVLGAVNMSDPKSILLLPFLFPVFILLLLVRSLSRSESWQNSRYRRHKKTDG